MTENKAVLLDDLCTLIERVASQDFSREEITGDTKFREDLALDSITLVALMFLCEEHFKVDVESNAGKIADFETIGDIVEFIDEFGE